MARVQAAKAVEGEASRRGIHLLTREESDELAATLRGTRGVDSQDVMPESPWLLLSVVALTVPLTWFLHGLMHRIGI